VSGHDPFDADAVRSAQDLRQFIHALMDKMEKSHLEYRTRVAQGEQYVDSDYFTGPYRGALENIDAWLEDSVARGEDEPSAEAWRQVAICLAIGAIYE